MKGKIKRISEAFSMQPRSCEVCTIGGLHEHGPDCIKAIGYSMHNLVDGDNQKQYEILRAYNFLGNPVFDFVASTMNIEYFTE